MKTETLRGRINAELADARASRRQGKEGRARVCARRAAGLAAACYYESRHSNQAAHSAYELLGLVQREEALPAEVRLAGARLATRVNTSGRLPHPQDPLEDARIVIETLLAEAESSRAEDGPSESVARGHGGE